MNAITLSNQNLPLVEYKGQRVVTFTMIDQAHQRPEGTARKSFNRHRSRFTEGRHFFVLTASVLCTQSFIDLFPPHTSKAIVVTEMGYLLLTKPFSDDLAWQVQEQLVENYFRPNPHFSDIRPVLIPSLEELEAMPLSEAQNLLAAAEHKSKWRHGKHGSAEMTQRKRELKAIRPAIERITALVQLTIPELGAFK
ncbi:ORF6N domain-containing protein [Rosenbergiella nectarea]|uniref:ORF6N domain-containing protein n=1 Tax=Rosenbergiella nectarea TaxID=988801 RepID=A0A1H9M5L2_9GAMM|nr:ORF6N domain-containing protein [Rosenbergiella nectarea]SER18739.1 ORF6N domain-containing protein [Rosenbergiella nectarea]